MTVVSIAHVCTILDTTNGIEETLIILLVETRDIHHEKFISVSKGERVSVE